MYFLRFHRTLGEIAREQADSSRLICKWSCSSRCLELSRPGGRFCTNRIWLLVTRGRLHFSVTRPLIFERAKSDRHQVTPSISAGVKRLNLRRRNPRRVLLNWQCDQCVDMIRPPYAGLFAFEPAPELQTRSIHVEEDGLRPCCRRGHGFCFECKL